jgi:diacylglycerol kinase
LNFLRSRARSFVYAFEGWRHVLRTQRNAWIHALISLAVLLVGAWLKLSSLEWAIIFLAMGIVWVAEFFNTALEAAIDLASPQKHPLAKIGKDVGAAAVLIAAGVAVVVGLIILGPPLLQKFHW